ncbi:MAG: hypothetical protein ABIH82_03260 [Candidatus Woesearchaeota archaeon]
MKLENLKKIEGLQTIETVMEKLRLNRQSALNLISKLKKEQHLTTSGGGKRKRIYKITIQKQLPKKPGMWDILNKYNSHFKLNPWYDHQVHGKYEVEDVLIDAIQTKSFRVILASLKLFNHINNWSRLYRLAKEKDCWQKVGALYDVARLFMKVKKMPDRYKKKEKFKKMYLFDKKDKTKEKNLIQIQNKWNIPLPFRTGDIKKLQG